MFNESITTMIFQKRKYWQRKIIEQDQTNILEFKSKTTYMKSLLKGLNSRFWIEK